ncbi:hypothetical protein QUB49_33890 [Microcoleus sp. AT9_B4]
MELERMEKLAALEHKIDTARERLRVNIGIRLMDTAQEIENIRLQLLALNITR